MRPKRNGYVLVEKLEEMRSLGRPRHKLEDSINKDLKERGWEGMEWTHLTQAMDQCRLL
jgi:hypothetical protein